MDEAGLQRLAQHLQLSIGSNNAPFENPVVLDGCLAFVKAAIAMES